MAQPIQINPLEVTELFLLDGILLVEQLQNPVDISGLPFALRLAHTAIVKHVATSALLLLGVLLGLFGFLSFFFGLCSLLLGGIEGLGKLHGVDMLIRAVVGTCADD